MAKDLFVNYDVSDDDAIWDPSANTVPSARVAVTTNYVEDEDSFSWDTDMATDLSLRSYNVNVISLATRR